MACMCGDTCCPSCGPAQGNFKCWCGAWASECEHYDADGALLPEFQAQADEALRLEILADQQYARDLVIEEALAAEYWRSQR